jgi:hypothetical protein
VLQSPTLEALFWGMSDLVGRCYDAPVATVEQPTLVTFTESAATKILSLLHI